MAVSCLEEVNVIIDFVSRRHQYETLKEEQKKVILNFIDGRDVFVCLPTGFGKRLCFILFPNIYDVLYHRPDGNSILVVVAHLLLL